MRVNDQVINVSRENFAIIYIFYRTGGSAEHTRVDPSFQTGASICTAVVLAPSSGRW
jgi:hypothetical protein